MDQRRADAEGGRVVHRKRRVRKLALVVAVQNAVVAGCLMVTLYVYWCLPDLNLSTNNVHIHFHPTNVEVNSTVQFKLVDSSNMMDLNDDKDEIRIRCTGPYIWYMEVCYMSRTKGIENSGTLQILVGSKTPVSSIELQTTHEVCRGHYRIIYLRSKEVATVRLESTENFKIKNVTMGLNYLLGKKCEY